MKRKDPTEDEKVACLLLENWSLRGEPIPFEVAQQMSAYQVVSLVHFHHVTYNSWEPGNNHPTILTPMLVGAHKIRTAKIDIPTIAKSKRIRKKQVIHKAKLAEKIGIVPENPAPRTKVKRKIQSRGFQGSRKFDGTIRWKDQRKGKGE